MNKLLLGIIVIYCNFGIFFSTGNSDNCARGENCEWSEERSSANSRYSAFENNILKNIESAKLKYEPCSDSNCSCFFDVMADDLAPFQKGIYKEMVRQSRNKGVKYQLLGGRIFRDKECMFPSRCAGIEHFLKNIIDDLPDMELIINVRDWPQVSKHYNKPLPVFSFSKTTEYYDIMYPAWSFWEGGPAIKLYPTGIGRWDRFRKSLKKKTDEWPWEKKIQKAFFRGSRTSNERDSLILLSRQQPDLVDAAYTKNQAWKSLKDTLGEQPVDEVSFEDHCRYKYLFNYRGVAASFRFKFLFLCKSLVFHVGDEWLEFFYPSLKPWVHYIPVKSDATEEDLERLLRFVQKNDAIFKKMASEGYNVAWKLLTLENVECYWKHLLTEYSKHLNYKVTVDKQLIDVTK